MKKLIEFYPCPKCKENLFYFALQNENELHLFHRLNWMKIDKNLFCSLCLEEIIQPKILPALASSDAEIIFPIVDEYIKNKSKSKKLKKIWDFYLKSLIKSRLKQINT